MIDHFSTSPGIVRTYKLGTPSFDSWTDSTDPQVQADLAARFNRLITFSPYFDSKLGWFPNGLMYVNAYAVYPGGNFNYDIVTNHPDWILKDSNGNLLHIPWGDNSQYAGDFSNTEFQDFLISNITDILNQYNYKGLFVDDVNMDWRVSDASGTFVTPINASTDTPMTITNWREFMASWVERIKLAFSTKEIVHNCIWYAGFDDGWIDNIHIQRQIAAADTVFVEFGVNDSGLTGGTGNFALDSLFRYVDNAALFNRSVVLSNCGGGTVDTAALEYGLVGYFLTNNTLNYSGDSGMAFDPANWYDGLEVNLGLPINLRSNSAGLWQRDFSAGKVFLNEPGASTKTITLHGPYYKIDGSTVTSFSLTAGQAIILSGHWLNNPQSLVVSPPLVHYEYGVLYQRASGDINFIYGAEDQPLMLRIYANSSWSSPIEIGSIGLQPLSCVIRNSDLYIYTFKRNSAGDIIAVDYSQQTNLNDTWSHYLIKVNEANQIIFTDTVVENIQSAFYRELYYDYSWVSYDSNASIFTLKTLDGGQWQITEPLPPGGSFTPSLSDSFNEIDSIQLNLQGETSQLSLFDLFSFLDQVGISLNPLPPVVIVNGQSYASDSFLLSDGVATHLGLGGSKSITITIENDAINICIKKFFQPS